MDWCIMKVKDPIAQKVIQRIADRSEAGTKKFGDTFDQTNKTLEETIIEGFENIPDAFLGLFDGKNFGKMIVKI